MKLVHPRSNIVVEADGKRAEIYLSQGWWPEPQPEAAVDADHDAGGQGDQGDPDAGDGPAPQSPAANAPQARKTAPRKPRKPRTT